MDSEKGCGIWAPEKPTTWHVLLSPTRRSGLECQHEEEQRPVPKGDKTPSLSHHLLTSGLGAHLLYAVQGTWEGDTPDTCLSPQGRCTFLSGHDKGEGTCHVLHRG